MLIFSLNADGFGVCMVEVNPRISNLDPDSGMDSTSCWGKGDWCSGKPLSECTREELKTIKSIWPGRFPDL